MAAFHDRCDWPHQNVRVVDGKARVSARTTAAGHVDGNAAVNVLLGGVISGGSGVDRIVARGRFQRADHLETVLINAASLGSFVWDHL